MAIGLPQEAFDKDGKIIKYIFRKVKNIPNDEYLTEKAPEDSHIEFWIGDDPNKAPTGYELLREPTNA